MSLVTWGGKLLLSPNGKLTLGPAAAACCCVSGCGCEYLPGTIWVIVNRTGGDFSDCPAGAFDGEVAEMSLVQTAPTKIWQGTLNSGYVVSLECTGEVDNGDGTKTVNFSIWACDAADETTYSTECTIDTGWDDLFLDTNAVYPFGFTINSCGCAVGATIDFLFYMTNPI